MTTLNYSILGLKDLVNDLENISVCISALSGVSSRVDASVCEQLREDQLSLIQSISAYASMLLAIESNPDSFQKN